MNKWESEKENLEKLIQDKVSYEEIGRRYGCSGANIKKQCKILGIALPSRRKISPSEHFNKGKVKVEICTCLSCGNEFQKSRNTSGKYCSIKCQRDYEHSQWVSRWKNGQETGIAGEYGISGHLRRYLFDKFNSKCSICGWGEVNPYTGTIPLEVEHIDGNYQNNSEENLTLLCPNHHSLTATYKGANRGSGRKERKKYT